jgi:hypothetical protein
MTPFSSNRRKSARASAGEQTVLENVTVPVIGSLNGLRQ